MAALPPSFFPSRENPLGAASLLPETVLLVNQAPYRSIGGIVAQVTIEERTSDELVVTEHPVEQGAPISDHAYKKPVEVTLRCGWSEAKSGNLSAYGGIYNLLLSWQAALNPFDLYTGRRKIPNMLIAGITTVDNQESAHALITELRLREVILVSTKTVDTKASGMSSDANNQQNPEETAANNDTGTKQLDNQTTGDGATTLAKPPEGGNDTGFVTPSKETVDAGTPIPNNPVDTPIPGNQGDFMVGANTDSTLA